MDREKLIEQLETDAIATDTGYVEVPLWLFSEILALLKEQEAVESDSEHHLFVCPVCRSVLRRNQKFCHECGKRIKWDRR